MENGCQTRKVIFSRKPKRPAQAPLIFNNNLWSPNQFSKINVRHTKFFLHLKIITKNNANYHIQSFHSTHLHYADFLRTQAFNGSFKQKQMLICQDWSLKMSIMNYFFSLILVRYLLYSTRVSHNILSYITLFFHQL